MNLPLGIQLALAALVGLGLGFIFGWLYGQGRAAGPHLSAPNSKFPWIRIWTV